MSWLGNRCYSTRSMFACVPVVAGIEECTRNYGRTILIQRGGKRPVKQKPKKTPELLQALDPDTSKLSGQIWRCPSPAATGARAATSAGTMVTRPRPSRLYPRKVEMKTLVSRLSVACHQRSGKYRTCRESAGRGVAWGLQVLGVPCALPRGVENRGDAGQAGLTSPGRRVHSSGR